MGLLAQIKSDYQFLKLLIESLSPSGTTTVSTNGVLLSGKDRENALQQAIDSNMAELTRLQAIINSGVLPSSYTSIITKKTYHPSPEELKEEKPLPVAIHSIFCAKTSRKRQHLLKSRFELYDPNAKQLLSFFVEHKTDGSYPHGNFSGKVKKCFSEVDEEKTPKYALKVFKKDEFNGDSMHELRTAMRGAFCSRILGRTGYAFRRNNKQYLLADWLQGTTLGETNLEKILSMPIPKRINLALMLISEIAVLHKHGITHCDIKPKNIMFTGDALHIFDFDSARLENEMIATTLAGPMHTPEFLEPQLNWDAKNNPINFTRNLNKKSDLYALGLSLSFFFPDVIIPAYEKGSVKVNGGSAGTYEFDTVKLRYGSKFKEHEQLGNFIISLVNDDLSKRIKSIEEAYDALSTILRNKYPSEAEDKTIAPLLKVIMQSTSSIDSGRKAFDEIESELVAFNARNEGFLKKFNAS